MTRIAFYAPLKSPRHATPSGDRTIARLLLSAWRRQGAAVDLASQLRARIAAPDPLLQRRLAARAAATADRLVAQYRRRPATERPQAWFTYHCYYKAVDWIGPSVAEALDIPYLLAEASHAPKRAGSAWDFNHRGTEAAIKAAQRIFCFNPNDKACLSPLVGSRRLIDLPPFLDLARFAPVLPDRRALRAKLARRHRLDSQPFWLLAVGMMRPGDKLASYQELATALTALGRRDWHLLIVGDGPARPEVRTAFAKLAGRIHFLGAQPPEKLVDYYAAADLLVWPAVNEAFGMALLEAQACALPVLAGSFGGVPAIVNTGDNNTGDSNQARTGWLAPPHEPAVFARLIGEALDSDLATVGAAARRSVEQRHDIGSAAAILKKTFEKLVNRR
jgi:glycosyltransferase involved in cell wall biosynthesis